MGVEYRWVGYINFMIFDHYLPECGKRYKIRRPCSDFMDMLRRLISRRIIIYYHYRAIITTEQQRELICALSNGGISGDLEWPLKVISELLFFVFNIPHGSAATRFRWSGKEGSCWKFTLVTLCAQLTRVVLAIANFHSLCCFPGSVRMQWMRDGKPYLLVCVEFIHS